MSQFRRTPRSGFRYTARTVRKVRFFLSIVGLMSSSCLGEETSFRHIKVPDAKGRQIHAVLTFSDHSKAVEVRPEKGSDVRIPYSSIEKFSYEFTERRRVRCSVRRLGSAQWRC